MTWTTYSISAGQLRSAYLYGVLIDRANHILENYTPVVGGISPMSRKTTNSGSLVDYCKTIITPIASRFYLNIVYEIVGGGTATFSATYGATTITATGSSSSAATLSIGPFQGSGTPALLSVQYSRDSGDLTAYGALAVAEATTHGIASFPPHADALATGYPITAMQIREMMKSPIDCIKARVPALAWFASTERAAANTITPGGPIWITHAYQITNYDYNPSFKVSILAPTATTATLIGTGNQQSISPSDAAVIATSAAVTGSTLALEFSGPVQSYSVYEV